MTDKKALRQHFKLVRLQMPDKKRNTADRNIARLILSLDEYKFCENFLCYVSSRIEVSTLEIINKAISDGKSVYAPRCAESGNAMTFHRITSIETLNEGRYGILEPDVNAPVYNPKYTALCVVPALSYDLCGYRLGFGKGYYDRFLSENSNVLPIGICYECCMSESLPYDSYDKKAKLVVTEKTIYDM